MENFWNGLIQAIALLASGDAEVYQVTLLTLFVSGTATLISVVVGLPLGLWLAFRDFPGKSICLSLINFGMGLPPVVVGLVVSLLFWRYGPLGMLGLMYTPWAMIIAQALIASPIVAGLSFAAIAGLNPKLRWQLLSLGATSWQANWLLIREARLGLLAAVMAGFGGVVSEVGASMMVGGNIKGQTRVLTTATVMEVSKGNYDIALAFSFILLMLAYTVIILLTILQQKGRKAW
ncbi:binding-protein-dependent transport systems inner membrane component [Thermosinus carboxydivorans Nor1]|uniref:Binding-protein-dependent transport systems inner membrane component n=1 Tax=Thermosinus carboxydivorans Nor1 TaxID=401526 RepID=A1HS27_9FIRM|nr:ABC transporter permease [Thermosinus carboxydivorans]EAX47202.1 binding-protein-dependent transport systems inner membrane component [Thermosinus carboxydivorans Nor1]